VLIKDRITKQLILQFDKMRVNDVYRIHVELFLK